MHQREVGIRLIALAFGSLQSMDDHALLLHLDRAWRWLSKVRQAGILDRTFGLLLRSMSDDITFLRNKRQHSENYLDPAKAQQYWTLETYKEMAWRTPPDWSSTINGVRKIGERVKILDVGPALDEFYSQLTDAGLWTLELTPCELARKA